MKKSILLTIVLAIIITVAMIGNVNAATAKFDKTTVKAGDTVTLTVKAKQPEAGIQFQVKYDTDLFTYKSADTGALTPSISTKEAGVVGVIGISLDGSTTEQTIKVTFTANKDIKTTTEKAITISDFVAGAEKTADLDKTSFNIKVEPKTPASTGDKETDKGTSGSTTTDKNKKPASTTTTTTNKTNGTTGKVTELPDTGAHLYVGAIALIVVAGAILLIRKAK